MSPVRPSTYRSIMKGTALFGGTQVVNILVNVLRGKMVAVLLGTMGLGISSLYMSTLMPLQQFFSLGLPLAVVSVIAATDATSEGGRRQLGAKVEAFRRCLFVLALMGTAFMLISAPWLGRSSFGDYGHTRAYMALAAALFFLVMEQGETSLLQSRRCLKQVAMRNIVNAFAGLVVSVPLYWLWGQHGIVPAIVLCAFIVWAYSRWQTRRLNLRQPSQSWSATWYIGKGIIALGFFMMLAALFGNITTYAINAVIRHLGNVSEVGLYQAATSITGQYVGLVFAAMATDYYPRLSSLTADRTALNTLVCKQLELVLLIVAPLVALLIITAPLLIRILLTEEFLPLTGVVRLMGVAIMCKAACFPLDYVSMAYGRKRYFFWMEGIWCNVKTFAVLTLFYYLWGLDGLGWGALVSGLIDVVVTTFMTRLFFGVKTLRLQIFFFLPLTLALGLCTALSFHPSAWVAVGGSIFCALLLSIGCLHLLEQRIDLIGWVRSKVKKKF